MSRFANLLLVLVSGCAAANAEPSAPGGAPAANTKRQAADGTKAVPGVAQAATAKQQGQPVRRRALVVGIDKYVPKTGGREVAIEEHPHKGRSSWGDLDGAVNDATAIGDILVHRFGFDSKNITLLKNEQASRKAILDSIERLTVESQRGDVAFVYYAGHGSQQDNSASPEDDKKDETIVPADSAQGAPDIRDKELARLYDRLVKTGAVVTIVMDSCNSGSGVRGPGSKVRRLDPIHEDAKDPNVPNPPPEAKALVLSAAQDDQPAAETTAGGHPHGRFTWALLDTLSHYSVDTPADTIFQRVKARMQEDGSAQEPVLAGPKERRTAPLLGGGPRGAGHTTVAVISRDDARLELQGGYAIGLTVGSELAQIEVATGKRPVRARIVDVTSATRSKAEIIEGDPSSLRENDLFSLDKYVVPPNMALRVHAAPSTDLKAALEVAGRLHSSTKIVWTEEPSVQPATHVVYWSGRSWVVANGSEVTELGAAPTVQSLERAVAGFAGARVFFSFPPTEVLRKKMPLIVDGAGVAAATDSPGAARYMLVGRVSKPGEKIEYAWVFGTLVTGPFVASKPEAPCQTEEGSKRCVVETGGMPRRTDWTPDADAERLAANLLRLARVDGWMQLTQGPPADERFPYRLLLRNAKDDTVVTDGATHGGQRYGLVLHAEPEALTNETESRYIYVFSIDSAGRSQILFPSSKASVEIRRPIRDESGKPPPEDIPLGPRALFEVAPPFGTDTYFLLTTNDALPDPTVLEEDAVLTRGGTDRGAPASPLEAQLRSVGNRNRGNNPVTPATWSLQALTTKSVK